jgi:hypothetical protein
MITLLWPLRHLAGLRHTDNQTQDVCAGLTDPGASGSRFVGQIVGEKALDDDLNLEVMHGSESYQLRGT